MGEQAVNYTLYIHFVQHFCFQTFTITVISLLSNVKSVCCFPFQVDSVVITYSEKPLPFHVIG